MCLCQDSKADVRSDQKRRFGLGVSNAEIFTRQEMDDLIRDTCNCVNVGFFYSEQDLRVRDGRGEG